jgi:hypothetical protein
LNTKLYNVSNEHDADGKAILINGPLWVAILDKAWAKANGSYANTINLKPFQTMRDLTGAPSFEYEIGEESLPEKDYESMKEAL